MPSLRRASVTPEKADGHLMGASSCDQIPTAAEEPLVDEVEAVRTPHAHY